MQSLQNASWVDKTKAAPDLAGLAGWVLNLFRRVRSERLPAIKQMHLLETLPLGGKRQLMLVSCGCERFLVGGGLDSIETIVRVQGEASFDITTKKLDGPCL